MSNQRRPFRTKSTKIRYRWLKHTGYTPFPLWGMRIIPCTGLGLKGSSTLLKTGRINKLAKGKKDVRILIVDDEKVARNVLTNHIKNIVPDCKVVEAEDGVKALCSYVRARPDVVFLDILMPVMTGDEFLDIIEQGYECGHLNGCPKVIVVTSIDNAAQLMALTRRSVVESVMSKPITRKKLEGIMKIIMGGRWKDER